MAFLAYGLTIDSDLPLGVPTVDLPAEIVVSQAPGPVSHEDVRLLAPESDNGWSSGRVGCEFWLGYSDVAEFLIDDGGTRISWWAPDDSETTVVHLVLDHVVPIALSRRGRAVLHAASLVCPSAGCFAIAGDSGWGKSTLAASLVGRGYRFVSDDCTVVELRQSGPVVALAYPGVRLADDSIDLAGLTGTIPSGGVSSFSPKQRLTLADEAATWDGRDRFVLDTIFVLDAPESVRSARASCRPLGAADALLALLGHSFHLSEGGDRATVLDRAADLVDAVTVRELSYERSPAGLVQVMLDIERALGESSPSG